MKDIIVGMGEALWDCLPEGRKLGGAPANFAYHAGQFGYHSVVISAVGNDPLGDEILTRLQDAGLDCRISKVAFPTGTVKVTLSGDGIPSYEICENVAWDNIPWSDELEELARHTKAVCFGSLAQRSAGSRSTILRFIDSMDADSERIFDINLRQSFYTAEVIGQSLRRSTILKLNDEEIEVIKDMLQLSGGAEDVCRQIIARYDSIKIVILTCGAVGSYVFSADQASWFDTPKVKVADTVGAGDSFTAAFSARYLNGKSIREAHRTAVVASAYVCTQNGAMPALPQDILEA